LGGIQELGGGNCGYLYNLSGRPAEAIDIIANPSSIKVIGNLLSYLVSFVDRDGMKRAEYFSIGDENIAYFVYLKG
jgi:hypothetical protein